MPPETVPQQPPAHVTHRHAWRLPLETAGFKIARTCIPLLPRLAVRAIAWTAGTLGWLAGGKLKRIGEANLTLAFGASLAPSERRRILRQVYRHFSLLTLDLFWFAHDTRRRLDRWVEVDPSVPALAEPKRLMVLTAHLGNWEILGMRTASLGRQLMSVAMPLTNPFVDREFIRLREATGQIIIPRDGATRKLLKGIRDGAAMAVLLDQNTPLAEGGAYVDFFGLPVPVSTAPAHIALMTRAHIALVVCLPAPGGKYRAHCERIIELPSEDLPREEAALQLTRRMTASVEAMVRKHPGYWLWLYKRWKFIPPGHDGAGYPFYARASKPGE